MTVRLKAIKNMVYAGRRVALGQEFDARGESDAMVLCAIKSAARVTVASSGFIPKSVPVYQTRMMTAQVPQTVQDVMPILHTEFVALDDAPVEVTKSEDAPYVSPDEFAAIVASINEDAQPESDLDTMDRDALFDMAVSLGLKPHHLTGVAKLRAAIAEYRNQ